MHKLKSRVEFLKTIYSLKMYIHIPIIEPLSAPAPSPPSPTPPKSCHLPKLQQDPFSSQILIQPVLIKLVLHQIKLMKDHIIENTGSTQFSHPMPALFAYVMLVLVVFFINEQTNNLRSFLQQTVTCSKQHQKKM